MQQSFADCRDVTRKDNFMDSGSLVDTLNIYQTGKKRNRLALYCSGNVTRNVGYFSDWNDIGLTIIRTARVDALYIVSIFRRIRLIFGKMASQTAGEYFINTQIDYRN